MPEVEEGMFFENPAKENEIIHKNKKKKKKSVENTFEKGCANRIN